ncbi:sporulation protein YjcZ [Cohnella kolymensis]|uniref:sporulation protein YjcZ n=1 Tax=Cohnella kolymensis TaxID=1590652 RepID=UPI001269E8A7|nr:sporulation protein YjcZ [Cohnella kolymensis]
MAYGVGGFGGSCAGYGGIGGSCAGYGGGRTAAFALVLFILLVIILRSGIGGY